MNLRFRSVHEIASTNDEVRAHLSDYPEGTWLRADRQTAGRGRLGRDWASPTGNLYASTAVHLEPRDPPAASLTFVASLAVFSVIVGRLTYVPELSIKWPNDVMHGRAKLAGILLERQANVVIVGIGINLTNAPMVPDRETTTLGALGISETATDLLHHLAQDFWGWLSIWRSDFPGILEEWQRRAHPLGTPLTARLPNGDAIDGLFDGLDADGALILRLADGARRVIHAGDVFLL